MYEKPDFYTDKAKKMGYPARSVFKLEEIDKKYKLCGKGRAILDIGAAPGSWSLYCLRKLKNSGTICAVDLQEIHHPRLSQDPAVMLIRGDVTGPSVYETIAAGAPFDLILSDAAPNTTGNKTVDSGKSFRLVSDIFSTFLPLLGEGGDILVKIFQGGDEERLLADLRRNFTLVKGIKPKASRNSSFELFLLGKGKTTPSVA